MSLVISFSIYFNRGLGRGKRSEGKLRFDRKNEKFVLSFFGLALFCKACEKIGGVLICPSTFVSALGLCYFCTKLKFV